MRRIELQNLSLRNFKGTRTFDLDLAGESASVFGANEAGKTTLADAFTWLLFGVDSDGRKQFDIKTLDAAGRSQPGVEHTVEGTLSIDGELVTLQRTFREQWTRKRGSAESEMTGHTTDLHIDGVPVKLSEFTERVTDILDEDTWRLISDPNAFPRLPWQKRREILLAVVGDITDDDVINSDPTLADLPGILGKRSIEEHRKVVMARRSEINKELTTLPARIDVVHQGKPTLPASTQVELQAVIDDLQAKRVDIEEERSRIKSGGETAELQRQLAEVKTSLLVVEQRVRAGVDAKARKVLDDITALQQQEDTQRTKARRLSQEKQDAEARIQSLDRRLSELRDEFQQIASMQAPEHTVDTCSACGQNLPQEQVQAAHEKALAQFNENRAANLERNQSEGRQHKEQRDALTARLAELEPELQAATAKADETAARIEALHEEVAQLRAGTPDATLDQEHQKLTAQAEELTARINSLQDDSATALASVQERLTEVDAELTELRGMLALFTQNARADERIAELEAQEKHVNQEFEQLERQLFLMDEFVRTKVALLESKVASNFELVNFRLFRQLVNGGIEPCADMTVNGVPFESLNRAAQVQAGIDVIKTLQRHHGVSTPVWVDGRESVTQLPEIDAQVISLIVNPADRNLRVELHSQEVTA